MKSQSNVKCETTWRLRRRIQNTNIAVTRSLKRLVKYHCSCVIWKLTDYEVHVKTFFFSSVKYFPLKWNHVSENLKQTQQLIFVVILTKFKEVSLYRVFSYNYKQLPYFWVWTELGLIWRRWSALTSFKYFRSHKYNYLTTISI